MLYVCIKVEKISHLCVSKKKKSVGGEKSVES